MAYSAGAVADYRIDQLSRQQQRRAGTMQNSDAYQFSISPTCPPSTSVHFQGGLAWWPTGALFPYGYYIPSYTVDLTDPAKVSVRVGFSSYTYTFTNPYWYAPCIIILSNYGLSLKEPWPDTVPDDAIYLRGTTGTSPYLEEFETAAEAEDEVNSILLQAGADYGIVAASLILRNNGDTSSPNQYAEIAQVSRGGSYLFRSVKVRWEAG